MLDWLASKIGVLIAIGTLTTFVLGLFAWQHSAMVDREGQGVADAITSVMDSFASVQAETVLNITYGNDPGQLPLTIGGGGYTVNITSDSVIVSSCGRSWISRPVAQCIPCNLTSRQFNLTEFETAGSGIDSGEHRSGLDFTIERARLEVSGRTEYATLVYWG
jgi:hypothetical protein